MLIIVCHPFIDLLSRVSRQHHLFPNKKERVIFQVLQK